MAKKARKRLHPMPRLGWKDKLLYWAVMVLTFAGALFSILFPIYYRHRLASMNTDVISYDEGNGYLQCFWLCFWLFFCFILVAEGFYRKRMPIFGRKDIKYGPPAYPRVYPLLMKNKPKFWESPRVKARKQKLTITLVCFLLVTLIFSIAVYPASLFSRYELLRDGTVVVYDTQNQQIECYYCRDIETVCLDAGRTSGGRYSSGSWYARMTVTFVEGETCSFSIRSFGDDWTTAIQSARALKEIYGPLVYIEDTEKLWKVVLDTDMTPAEKEMLYELYEVK